MRIINMLLLADNADYTARGAKIMNEKEVIVKEWKKFRRYKSGADFYEMSQSSFERLAREAGAVIKLNKMAYVDCQLFEEYLVQFRLGE